MTLFRALLFAFLPFLITSCGDREPPELPPLEIPVIQVIQQDVPVILNLVGQTYGSADIPIRARVDGTLESINFLEGRVVKEGQLLYTIDTRPFDAKVIEAQGYLSEAYTQRVKAKSDLDRLKPLAEINAVSKQDLDSAVAQYDAAIAAVQTAQAQVEQAKIELGYTKIYAPISGRIGLTKAEIGEYVGREPNPIVLNYVSQADPIRVKFSINEKEYLRFAKRLSERAKKLEEGPETEDRLELILADGSVHKHKGHVTNFEAAIDPTTGTLTIEADFPNPEGLVRAGQFAKVRAAPETIHDALVIPQRAIAELQGIFQAYVIDEGGTVEIREVKLGPKFDNMIVVEEGVTVGELVATEGLLRMRDGMKVVPVEKNNSSNTSS